MKFQKHFSKILQGNIFQDIHFTFYKTIQTFFTLLKHFFNLFRLKYMFTIFFKNCYVSTAFAFPKLIVFAKILFAC